MTDEISKASPMSLIVAALLSSGIGGVGTNYVMNTYKVDQLKEEIQTIKIDDKEIRENIKALIKVQNECMTSAKILEYRLNNRESRK